MNKNVRVKVIQSSNGKWNHFGICEGGKILFVNMGPIWRTKEAAARNAKAMAKRIGIPYEDGIIQ